MTELNWHGYTALGEFLSHHRIAFLLLYYKEINLWSENLKRPCFQAEISNRKRANGTNYVSSKRILLALSGSSVCAS